MDEYEGARMPRVPRRPAHGPPVYQAPMYGPYDGRMGSNFPPPQGPPSHHPRMMQQPYHQPQMPHHFPQPQQHPNYPGRNVREWDSQPDFNGDRQDFKRRRYPDPFHGPQGGNPNPHPLPPGMFQQPPPHAPMAPPYRPMAMPQQHDLPPRNDIPSMPAHMPSIHQPSFPYPAAHPPAIGGPPQNSPGMNDSYHNLPAPPRRDRNPQPPEANPSVQSDLKTSVEGPSLGSPGRSSANPSEPMTFKDYLAKQPDSISAQAAQDAYAAYLRDFTRKQPNKFFDMHKEEEWFKERYDPKYVRDRVKRIEVEVADRAVEFRNIWEMGGNQVCAPCLSVAPRESRRDLSKDKSGVEAPGEVVDIMEDRKGDPTALEEVAEVKESDMPSTSDVQVDEAKLAMSSGDDEEPNNAEGESKVIPVLEAQHSGSKDGNTLETDDANAVESEEGEAKADPNGEARTEAKVESKLSDSKEALKDESVVLSPSDTMQDGAIEEVDVKEEERDVPGKPELVSHSLEEKPSIHALKSEEEQPSVPALKNEEEKPSAPTLQNEEEKPSSPSLAPEDNVGPSEKSNMKENCSNDDLCLPLRRPHQEDTIFMRGIPINLRRAALVKTLRHGPEGNKNFNLRRLKIGDINPNQSLHRFAWAVYESEYTAKQAMGVVRGALVKSTDVANDEKGNGKDSPFVEAKMKKDEDPDSCYTIDCMFNKERRKKFSEGRILPTLFADPQRMKRDASQAIQIMRHLDQLRKIAPDLNPLTNEYLESLNSDESRLDHAISYLREVHYFCYYSGNEFLEDPTSMPPQEMRPSYSTRQSKHSEADARLVRRVDERAKWVLERDYDRPRSNGDNGEATREEYLKAWLDANTSDEGNGRFRCRLPPYKLFKGPAFVHKHIKTKHAGAVEEVLENADLETYRANFENDASKEEVVSIWHQGVSRNSAEEKDNQSGMRGDMVGGNGMNMMNNVGVGYPQAGPNMGMYRAPFMGVGMQFPMMGMPLAGATGFAPGYGTAAPFPPAGGVGFPGQGMGIPGMVGMQDSGGGGGGYRGRGGRGSGREGGRRGGRNWGRGGMAPYGNGRHADEFRDRSGPRRGSQQSMPVDPRAKGRRYNDLDAPADQSFDLIQYDDI